MQPPIINKFLHNQYCDHVIIAIALFVINAFTDGRMQSEPQSTILRSRTSLFPILSRHMRLFFPFHAQCI